MPAAACLKADHASTTDLVPRVAAYYSVGGVLYPMPFNDSNPVLYYNKVAFEKAGLDPDQPPATLEEVKADAQKIVASGAAKYGIALKTDSWLIEHWLAKANQTLVNNGNGRTARATKVTFDNPTTVRLFTWIHDMVQSKLALSTGTNDYNHYLAVGNGTAAMTIDTSAALGTIFQRLAAGEYKGVHVGTGAMPGLANSTGGVLVGGAANYIINRSSPEKQAAAYEFAKFLMEPQTQSDWAAATGYVPISRGATTRKPLTDKWIEQPGFKVAYDQLLEGATSDATAGTRDRRVRLGRRRRARRTDRRAVAHAHAEPGPRRWRAAGGDRGRRGDRRVQQPRRLIGSPVSRSASRSPRPCPSPRTRGRYRR